MKRYCFDTSGISNPAEYMPQDIHQTMWRKVLEIFKSGSVAVTPEIYDEMVHIPGEIGACIIAHKDSLVLEINQSGWDWKSYVQHSTRMNEQYRGFISDYGSGSPKTVGLNDMSIVALAKSLNLPCVSMEGSAMTSPVKRKIPDICIMDGVDHLTFSEFLRKEGITL